VERRDDSFYKLESFLSSNQDVDGEGMVNRWKGEEALRISGFMSSLRFQGIEDLSLRR